MSVNEPAVEFNSVRKSLASTPILRDIELALPAGLTTAIVGESGSGKSTLLQHINGVLRPDHGTVRVFGRPVDYDNLSQFRRQIGYAVQGVGLFPHLTVEDNVCLLARLQRWSEERMRVRFQHLLAVLELSAELAPRYPNSLSGGQQQRVGLCRAMMLEPRLLLLDEPFSGVDPITRRKIHEEFLRLRAGEPVSVVLVTHDMHEAVKLAQHIVILLDGQVLQAGPLEQVLQAPEPGYVERLLREQLT